MFFFQHFSFLASEKDHTNNDCLVVVVLTHGGIEQHRKIRHSILNHEQMNYLYARDAKYPVRKLLSYFTDNKCPTLSGKPRMFFIQACQGNHADEGFQMRKNECSDGIETDSKAFNPMHDRFYDYLNCFHQDFLVVYASLPGYLSVRDTENGTWFIQELCRVFNKTELTENLHVAQLISVVNKSVTSDYEAKVDLNNIKQTICTRIMLTSLVFFREKRTIDE